MRKGYQGFGFCRSNVAHSILHSTKRTGDVKAPLRHIKQSMKYEKNSYSRFPVGVTSLD